MEELKNFGYNPEDRGVYRPSLSSADIEARHWYMNQLKELALTVEMDNVANVIGRFGAPGKPPIAIGSHLDSVPCGGIFDGTLGAVGALECIRVLKENGIELRHPIEVIATSDEEGRFGGMLGAQALTGHLKEKWLNEAHTLEGESLQDTLRKKGFNPEEALKPRYVDGKIAAWLELHIEQGPLLDEKRKSIGVVENISGVFKWLIKLIGKADHAGTASMDMRSDAFMGLADFGHELRRIIDEEGTDKSRLTIGKVELKPGYAHTIPGQVDFTLVGRDADEDVMNNLDAACRKVLSAISRKHRLSFEVEERSWLQPQPCDTNVAAIIESCVKGLNYESMYMDSGAGHDTQFFASIAPAGLIFVPSVNGVSHAPDEWTHWPDVKKGIDVLINTVIALDADPAFNS